MSAQIAAHAPPGHDGHPPGASSLLEDHRHVEECGEEAEHQREQVAQREREMILRIEDHVRGCGPYTEHRQNRHDQQRYYQRRQRASAEDCEGSSPRRIGP
ncbi:hypothetical protein FM106_05635 [Brachybacterium faecium]|nr:hypothetical protein FM106_05635 [Brachybacterium faecium]